MTFRVLTQPPPEGALRVVGFMVLTSIVEGFALSVYNISNIIIFIRFDIRSHGEGLFSALYRKIAIGVPTSLYRQGHIEGKL